MSFKFAFAFFATFVVLAQASRFDVDRHWKNFKAKHARNYSSPREENFRRNVFAENLIKVINHNVEADLGLHTYRLGVNKFADFTLKEFSRQYKGLRGVPKPAPSVFTANQNGNLPTTVDWRNKGLVTPVKNQEQCGSCWAFSAIASLEGQHAKKTGQLVSLSEQNLVDCSGPEGNDGCEGGLMDQAFDYIKKNKGVDTEKSYPYEAVDGECRFKKSSVGATVKGYVDIDSGNEKALQQASASIGPISVAIDASSFSFQLYSGGVYNEKACSTSELDHGVTVVGYGTDEETGKDYWLVKNSWGSDWGEDGYIRMSRNDKNQCGIATQASYPLV